MGGRGEVGGSELQRRGDLLGVDLHRPATHPVAVVVRVLLEPTRDHHPVALAASVAGVARKPAERGGKNPSVCSPPLRLRRLTATVILPAEVPSCV